MIFFYHSQSKEFSSEENVIRPVSGPFSPGECPLWTMSYGKHLPRVSVWCVRGQRGAILREVAVGW